MLRNIGKLYPGTIRCWLLPSLYLIALFVIFFLFVWTVHAEGSRTLYPAGATGFRANIEWRTSFYGNFLRRRSLLKVYAQTGEAILLGSSAVGVSNGDIQVYNPNTVTGPVGNEIIPPNSDFSCVTQRGVTANPNQGQITSRAQELAGPDTIADPLTASPGNAIPNGFVPCFYIAPQTGIYHVVFHGPAGANSDIDISPTGEIDLTSPANFNAQQGTSIAAWDVTVRSSLTSTNDINGRLFVDYLTQYAGGWPRPVNSTYLVITRDGYVYQTNLRQLDANGFIVYANSVGFFNSDGSPLYHDVVADPSLPQQQKNQLTVMLGGVSLAPPSHLLFLNTPSPEALTLNNIPLTPIVPQLTSFEFSGKLNNNNTYVGGGGVFSFTSNITGTYRLIISRDGIDFDPDNPLNRIIRNVQVPGPETIIWDGLDNAGDPFPVGQNYQAQLTVRAGEHHMPMLDVESSLQGGPTYTLLNPPGGVCPPFAGGAPSCTTGFYDDRGYTTANGTNVGTPGVVLPGNAPPNPPNSNLLTGFDTTTNQRSFGDGSADGFGDAKGLDIWTFFPSQPRLTPLNILALNLAITKTDGGITTFPGGSIVYTLDYSNTDAIDATGVVITETVPLHTTFNQAASTPTSWTCPDGSPAGTVCTTTLGPVDSNTGGAIRFAVTVFDPLPAGVTEINNTSIIGDDNTRGPEPLHDNSDTEDTPVSTIMPAPPTSTPTPTPPPAPTSTPPGSGDGDDNSDDDDDDDGTIPPEQPGPTAISSPGETAGLPSQSPSETGENSTPSSDATPTLPVLLLPETGHTDQQSGSAGFIIRVLLTTLILYTIVIWKFLRPKDG